MNAAVRHYTNEIEDFRLQVPEQALQGLRLRLRRARSLGEGWDFGAWRGASPETLDEVLDHWLEGFDFRRLEAELNTLGLQRFAGAEGDCVFLEVRSSERSGVPLLLLTETVPRVETLLGPLAEPRKYGRAAVAAFHVVCPIALEETANVASRAQVCADLMQKLGHDRYVVHGSGGGAEVAQRLAALDAQHVMAIHLTRLSGFPSADPLELAWLSSVEKSQLALLNELETERRFNAPESPVDELASMVAQLADFEGKSAVWCERLLGCLTLREVGRSADCDRMPRSTAATWGAEPGSSVPMALSAFPLDAPSLRRIVERRHRVVSWTEHERGGAFPELEQPELLLGELCAFFPTVVHAAFGE
jgi:microsomal epoxide hydrolase